MRNFGNQDLVTKIIDLKSQLKMYQEIMHTFAENVTDEPTVKSQRCRR